VYATLLQQQFKKTWRSKVFSQGWGIKILIGFMVLYFGGAFLLLGIFMPELLKEAYPKAQSITAIFNSFILYYFLVDLAMRFFLQDLNLLSVQHYLLQNIRKSKVINFLLGTSIFSFFNALPLFFVVPFAFRGVKPEMGLGPALIWLLSMLMVVLTSHFIVIFIKRAAAVKQWVFFVFAGLVGALLVANSFDLISIREISSILFTALGQVWFLAIPLALVAITYTANFRFLQKQSYIDQWKKQGKEASTQRFGYLESKGALGTMIANELKLILRNKRTKSILVMTAIFCAYGLLFYAGDDVLEGVYQGFGWKIFAGIFMTGIFMINYGQFLIGWEGAYFDGILTRAYPMQTFFKAKFWLLVFSAVITYILTLGYVYFTIDALWINTACFIYNVGVNSFVLLFASTYQKKKIDLSKGSAFNYQGTSATQFIIVLPLMILPILIFQAFNIFDKPYYGLAALAGCGLVSLACSKAWFAEIAKNFQEKKYKNAAGFREN
jgi:hypothetical protein